MNKELTVVEHLEELRRRVIVSMALIFVASLVAFPFASGVLEILKFPSSGLIQKLAFFNPQEAFLIHIKLSFLMGFVISMPVILYNLWAFVAPAIDDEVKRRGTVFLISSVGAFACGVLFGFILIVPTALRFLLSFSRNSLEPVISVSSYISFVTGLILSCGFAFEMPVLSYLLSKIGIIDYRFLRSVWKYAVIIIFIIAAVVTPTPDVFNMAILAVPMLLLYEISILVSMFAGRRNLEVQR